MTPPMWVWIWDGPLHSAHWGLYFLSPTFYEQFQAYLTPLGIYYMCKGFDMGPMVYNGELKQRRRRRQRERQKRKRLWLAKQQLCMRITLFCTFLCRHYTTTTWNFLISRFKEDVNTRQLFSFYFCGQTFRIQLLKKSPTFDKLKELE